MSDTPRTDDQAVGVIGFYSCATVPANFARELERELALAQADSRRLDWLDTQLRRPRIDGVVPFMYWLGDRYKRGPFRQAIDQAAAGEKQEDLA